MGKHELIKVFSDVSASVVAYALIYAILVGSVGLAIVVTKWVLRMVGVM